MIKHASFTFCFLIFRFAWKSLHDNETPLLEGGARSFELLDYAPARPRERGGAEQPRTMNQR